MMNNFALIPVNDFGTLQSIAAVVTKSGFAKLNNEQALYVMLKGFELGISPLQALDGINIVQGKPTCAPQLMLALINRSNQLEDMIIESTDIECKVTMTRKGRTAHVETFTIADAKRMGLEGKDNWKKQPKTMLKWRAVAAAARIVFPDVIQGLYTPEELGAEVNVSDDGEMTVLPTTTLEIPATVPVVETPKHWAFNGGGSKISALIAEKKLTWDAIKSSIEPGKTLEHLSDTSLEVWQVEARINEIAEGLGKAS